MDQKDKDQSITPKNDIPAASQGVAGEPAVHNMEPDSHYSGSGHEVKTGKSKKKPIMLGVIALLVLLVGGAFAGWTYVQGTAQYRLSEAINNMRDADSYMVSFASDTADEEFVLTVDGELTYIADPLQMGMKADIDIFITKLGLEGRYVDGDYYVKVGGLNGLAALLGGFGAGFATTPEEQAEVDAQLAALNSGITQLNDQWVVISGSLLESAGFDIEEVAREIRDNFGSVDNLSNVLEVVETHDDDEINGSTVMHVTLRIDEREAQDSLADFVTGLTIADQTITREEAREQIEELFDNIDSDILEFDAWVEKSTNNFSKFEFKGELDEGVEQTLTIEFSDFNSVAALEVPEDPLTLLEVTAIFTEIAESLGFDDVQVDDVINTLPAQL